MEDVEDRVQDYINEEMFDDAITYLNEVKKAYIDNRRTIIETNSYWFKQLDWMHELDREMEMKGEKYPDGSKYRFAHEIRKLINSVHHEKEKKVLPNIPKNIGGEQNNNGVEIEMPELAIKIALEGIDKEWEEIAKEWGFVSKTSGRRLQNLYYKYATSSKRIETDGLSNTQIKNRIQTMEKSLQLIENEGFKNQLKKEIKTLQGKLI